jgi:hypothetical protein
VQGVLRKDEENKIWKKTIIISAMYYYVADQKR